MLVGRAARPDHENKRENAMSASVIQYVFKPNPGTDLQTLLGLIKEAADLWKKHGADVSL